MHRCSQAAAALWQCSYASASALPALLIHPCLPLPPAPQAGTLLERLAKAAAVQLGFDDGLPPDDALASALDWQSRVWFPPR